MNATLKLLAGACLLALSAGAMAQQNCSSSSSSSSGNNCNLNTVPEPSSLPLVALGLVGAAVVGRFLKKKK